MTGDDIPCDNPTGGPHLAYSLNWVNPVPPCPHGHALCGRHNIDGCVDCRLDAEAHMYDTPQYDKDAS